MNLIFYIVSNFILKKSFD